VDAAIYERSLPINSPINVMLGRTLAPRSGGHATSVEFADAFSELPPKIGWLTGGLLRLEKRRILPHEVYALGSCVSFELARIKEWGLDRIEHLRGRGRYIWEATPVEMMQVAISDLRTLRGYKLSRMGLGYFDIFEVEDGDAYERNVQLPQWGSDGGR
jgi:hypothetical protein